MPEIVEQRTVETQSTPEGSVTVETHVAESNPPAPPPEPPPEPEEPKWLTQFMKIQTETAQQFQSGLQSVAESLKTISERQAETEAQISALEDLLTEEPETPSEIDGVPLPASAPPQPESATGSGGTSSVPPANDGPGSHPAPAAQAPPTPAPPESHRPKHRWI